MEELRKHIDFQAVFRDHSSPKTLQKLKDLWGPDLTNVMKWDREKRRFARLAAVMDDCRASDMKPGNPPGPSPRDMEDPIRRLHDIATGTQSMIPIPRDQRATINAMFDFGTDLATPQSGAETCCDRPCAAAISREERKEMIERVTNIRSRQEQKMKAIDAACEACLQFETFWETRRTELCTWLGVTDVTSSEFPKAVMEHVPKTWSSTHAALFANAMWTYERVLQALTQPAPQDKSSPGQDYRLAVTSDPQWSQFFAKALPILDFDEAEDHTKAYSIFLSLLMFTDTLWQHILPDATDVISIRYLPRSMPCFRHLSLRAAQHVWHEVSPHISTTQLVRVETVISKLKQFETVKAFKASEAVGDLNKPNESDEDNVVDISIQFAY